VTTPHSATPELFIDTVDHGEVLVIHLDGVVNEDNRLMADASAHQKRRIVVNSRNLHRLNSCGVRDWVRWIQELESRGNEVYLVSCHPSVVSQINMVSNFCGARGKVLSFQAPYFCETCDAERLETFTATTLGPTLAPPPALCAHCGEAMEFDDVPQSYFAFTKQHGVRKAGDNLELLLPRLSEFQLTTKVAALKELGEGSRLTSRTTPVDNRGAVTVVGPAHPARTPPDS
jgi:anti-anti-sigma regulatory factor